MKFKCFSCKFIIDEEDLVDDKCPNCKMEVREMCKLDHLGCAHDITPGVSFCPLCGEPVCPECMAHDVVQISRVTGYLQEVSGWNAGKLQELKDRNRYSIT